MRGVTGAGPAARGRHESSEVPYGLSKLAQEQAAFRLGKLLEIPVVALRYSSVQGSAAVVSAMRFAGFAKSLPGALEAGKAPAIFEDGKQLRDYVHVSDAVEASMLVLDDPLANGQAFNVGSGRGVTVLDFVRVLAQKTRAQISPEIPGTYRAGDSRHAISSVSRLQSLGWKPKKGLNEILDDYLAWLASEHNRGDRAELAVESMGRAGIIRHGAAREHAHTAGD